mgnify:FL=1
MSADAARLGDLIAGPDCIAAPGVFDGFSARIAARAGFRVLHASGGAIARAVGHPDLGLVTMTEMLGRMSEIVEAAGLPVFADADTGFGDARNAARAARLYRAAGLAGLHVEDQTFPKRCGQMAGVALVPAAEMVEKIAAMRDAVGPDLVLAGRTDAVAVEGLGAAIERMGAYLAAGADMAFVEGIDTLDQVAAIGAAFPGVPTVFNQARASEGGVVPIADLARHGVRLAIYPGDLQRGAAAAMQRVVEAILRTGSTETVASDMLTNAARDAYFD